jgi:hypothetical protein
LSSTIHNTPYQFFIQDPLYAVSLDWTRHVAKYEMLLALLAILHCSPRWRRLPHSSNVILYLPQVSTFNKPNLFVDIVA